MFSFKNRLEGLGLGNNNKQEKKKNLYQKFSLHSLNGPESSKCPLPYNLQVWHLTSPFSSDQTEVWWTLQYTEHPLESTKAEGPDKISNGSLPDGPMKQQWTQTYLYLCPEDFHFLHILNRPDHFLHILVSLDNLHHF